jgi:hypothetical protein
MNEHLAGVDHGLQIEAQRFRIAHQLARMFVQAHQKCLVAAGNGVAEELHAQYRFAGAGDAADQRHGTLVDAAVHHCVDGRRSRRQALFGRGLVVGRGNRPRLGAPVHVHAHLRLDAHGVAAADEILAARFHHRQAALHAAPVFIAREADDGVEHEALVGGHARHRFILFGRDHGRHAQARQAFDEQVHVFAERHVVRLGIQAQGCQAVDQQALRAHGAQRGGKDPIVAAELAQQHCRAGLDDLDLALVDQALQIPVEAGGVAQQLGGIEFERHDGARLIVVQGAMVDKTQAQRGLAGAWRTFHNQVVIAWNAAV